MRKLGLFRGPEAHSAQSMECRCLSQFRTQQPKSGARRPRTPFRVCPHWSQLRSSMGQGPRMSSRLQREGGCYCPGPTPRYLYPSPAFSHEGNESPSYCSGWSGPERTKRSPIWPGQPMPLEKSLSSTRRLVLSPQRQPQHFTANNLPAHSSRGDSGVKACSTLSCL